MRMIQVSNFNLWITKLKLMFPLQFNLLLPTSFKMFHFVSRVMFKPHPVVTLTKCIFGWWRKCKSKHAFMSGNSRVTFSHQNLDHIHFTFSAIKLCYSSWTYLHTMQQCPYLQKKRKQQHSPTPRQGQEEISETWVIMF